MEKFPPYGLLCTHRSAVAGGVCRVICTDVKLVIQIIDRIVTHDDAYVFWTGSISDTSARLDKDKIKKKFSDHSWELKGSLTSKTHSCVEADIYLYDY